MSSDAAAVQPRVRAPRNNTLSIKSLILLMLLAVSIGSNLVVGIIGYVNGTDSLKAAAIDRLVEVRDSRSREITSLFDSIQSSLLLASRDSAVVDAEQAFSSGFDQLDSAASGSTLTDAQEAQLQSYFTDDFGPKLQKSTGKTADASSFLPSDPAARYLLYHYALAKDPSTLGDAGDGSAWSAASAQFHDYLSRMASLLKFGDLALIDPSGRVVYTVDKNVDLGANLTSGPYSFTSLATGFDQAMSQNRLHGIRSGVGCADRLGRRASRGVGQHRRGHRGAAAGIPDRRRDDRRPELAEERTRHDRRDLPSWRRRLHALAVT